MFYGWLCLGPIGGVRIVFSSCVGYLFVTFRVACVIRYVYVGPRCRFITSIVQCAPRTLYQVILSYASAGRICLGQCIGLLGYLTRPHRLPFMSKVGSLVVCWVEVYWVTMRTYFRTLCGDVRVLTCATLVVYQYTYVQAYLL